MAKIKTNYVEIIARDSNPGKPYISVRYFDPKDRTYHHGYGSYDLKDVYNWLKKELEIVSGYEIVNGFETADENAKRAVEKKKTDLTMDFARVLSDIYKAASDLNNVKTYEDLAEWYETRDVKKVLAAWLKA